MDKVGLCGYQRCHRGAACRLLSTRNQNWKDRFGSSQKLGFPVLSWRERVFEMYSDRVEAETVKRKTVKNLLNGDFGRQLTTRKRRRQDDDKWEHDLFSDDKPPRLSSWICVRTQKLSGTKNPQPRSTSNLAKSIREVARPALRNASGEAKAASNKATKNNSQQANTSVDSFLESLGLDKYSTSFQVEEVDMDALMHMTDDDLKAQSCHMICFHHACLTSSVYDDH
ncbi:hypothetical protein N665_0124s0056 [Sinapis alba]|nr:hypothetical protein N665_0124s0056 [Sinapis alba]